MQLRLKLTKKWSIGTPEKHQFVLRYIPVFGVQNGQKYRVTY